MTKLVVVARAYNIKDELGGGFRGLAYIKDDGYVVEGSQIKGDIRGTLEEARNDAKRFAADMHGERRSRRAYYHNSKTKWRTDYYLV